jgi:hypothetical protein
VRRHLRRRQLRKPKIQNFSVPTLGDENVRGFDVAMDDPFRMRRIERVGNFDSQLEQHFELDRAASDAVLQRRALQ